MYVKNAKIKYMKTVVKKYYFLILILYFIFLFIYSVQVSRSIGKDVVYDEAVVYQVSKQPIKQLFDTVTSEPHPPAFYLFIKLIGANSILYTKYRLIAVSAILITIVNIFHYKTIRKLNLEIPLLSFFVSYAAISGITTIKQDAISMPIFVSFFLTVAAYAENDKSPAKALISTFLHMCTLLIFGYLYFISALILFLMITLYETLYRKSYKSLTTFLALSVLLAVYYLSYGKMQLESNIGRFSWVYEFPQSVVHIILSSTRAMHDRLGLAEDMVLVIIFFTLGIFVFNLQKSAQQKYVNVTVSAVIANLIFLVSINGLVRERYATALWLYIIILVHKTLDSLKNKQAYIVQAIFMVFLALNGIISLANNQRLTQLYFTKHRMAFEYLLKNKLAEDERIGYIILSPTAANVYYNEQFSEYSQFVPVNFHLKDPTDFNISRELLTLDGDKNPINEDDFYRAVTKLKINKFLYFLHRSTGYFDETDSIFKTLNKHCQNAEFTRSEQIVQDFVFFSDCN